MRESPSGPSTPPPTRPAGRRLFAALAGFATLALLAGDAAAQQTSRCWLLEQELAAFDRAGRGDSAEVDRYEAAIAQQQQTLDRTEQQAERAGCFRRGFLFFRPQKPPECRQLEASIDKMRNNLDDLVARRDRLIGPVRADDPGRRRIVRLLAENNCGAQYSREARFGRPGGLFGNLFEEDSGPRDGFRGGFGERMLGDVATYRTLCVRTCDGYYFPISFATLPQRFEQDAAQCRAMCPTAVVELFVHQNPGGSVEEMTSLNGQPYSAIPTAFRYRKEYVRGCSCNPYTLALEEAETKGAGGGAPTVVGPEAAAEPAARDEARAPADGETAPAGSPGEAADINVFRPGETGVAPAPRFTTRTFDDATAGPNIIRVGPRRDTTAPEPARVRSREELPPYLDPLTER